MARKPTKSAARKAAADALKPELLAAYKRMLAYQFVGAVWLVAVLVAIIVVAYTTQFDPPLLILVMLAGMMGAFFSALMRLYKVDDASAVLISPTVSRLGGFYLLMYSFVPIIVGAVASVVLYVAFVAELVHGGGLIPTISCRLGSNEKCVAMRDLLNNYGPSDAANYAKALIWAFIAGFSERLVPDTLQTLVAKQEGQGKK